MTSFAVMKDEFYLLDTELKIIYNSEAEAVEGLTKIVLENTRLNPETITIWKVDVSRKEWSISQVPWAKIAVALLRRNHE